METSSFALLYVETDPGTGQPSAGLYLKPAGHPDYQGIEGKLLITAPGLSFIELDAEIRRLHAELDEVRARAKKKFYQAESMAMAAAGY